VIEFVEPVGFKLGRLTGNETDVQALGKFLQRVDFAFCTIL